MGYGLNITGERGGGNGEKTRNGHALIFVCSVFVNKGFQLDPSFLVCSFPNRSDPFRSVQFRSVLFFVILLMMTNLNFSKVFWYFYVIILTWQLYISRRYFGIFTLYNPDMATIHFSLKSFESIL